MNVDFEENPGDVAATQEPTTLEPNSEMQVEEEGDTVTQEPVYSQVVNAAAEENLGDVAVTQEPTTLIVNLDMLEDTAPQDRVLLPLRYFINLDSEQEGHYKKGNFKPHNRSLSPEVGSDQMEKPVGGAPDKYDCFE